MGKLDVVREEKAESLHLPEWMSKELYEALKYLRAHGKEIANSDSELHDVDPITDVLNCLDQDLQDKMSGTSILTAIEPHSTKCAHEKIGGKNVTTFDTLNLVRAHKELDLYWLTSLTVHPEDPSALNFSGGVYDMDISIDEESTTGGGAEIQQALSALVLHRADVMAKMGDKNVNKKMKAHMSDNRSEVVTNNKEYLAKAREGKHPWQILPHLRHIKTAVTSKKDVYSHNPDLRMQVDRPQAKPLIADSISPDKDKTRIIRSNKDGTGGYFLDLDTLRCQSIDPELLGRLLESEEPDTKNLGIDEAWHEFKDGYDLRYWQEQVPPAFSISSGIYEKKRQEAMKAAACGNSMTHITFEHGKIMLQFSHVPENGASAKLAALGVARAVQETNNGIENLAKSKMPLIELRPAYNPKPLPSYDKLNALENTLRKTRNKDERSDTLHDDKNLNELLGFLELENVRIRFNDFKPPATNHLKSYLNELNAKYTDKRATLLRQFIEGNRGTMPLSEEAAQELINFLNPPLTIQDLIAIGARQAINAPTASNALAKNPAFELTHPSIANMFEDERGNLIFDHPKWMPLYRTEIVLSQVAANIYNIFKLITSDWRRIPLVGAENLGIKFSPEVTKYMQVRLHFSDLSTPKRKVTITGDPKDSKMVLIDGFETAKPDPDEYLANAMSCLTTEEGQGYLLKPRFRDNLTAEMLESLPIDDSENYQANLKLVSEQINSDILESQDDSILLRAQISLVHDRWNELNKEYHIDQSTFDHRPKNTLILTTIMREMEPMLKGRKGHIVKRALQTVVVAGMRRSRARVMTNILNLGK